MRKEVILAIIAGGFLGVIIAFGFWRANVALKTPPQDEITTSENTQNDTQVNLTIASPTIDSVVGDTPLLLTGLTTPNSIVIVSAEKQDYTTLSDNSGNFSQEVDLIGGVNEIATFAFDENQNKSEDRLLVVYSTAFFKTDTQTTDQ